MSKYRIWDQLLQLKALTESTGAIHEAQVFQLKMWSRLAFGSAKDISVGVDVGGKLVEYRVETNELTPIPHQKVLDGLGASTKDLLGDYFTVTVLFDGVAIFEDRGKPKKKRRLRDLMKRLMDADKDAAEG